MKTNITYQCDICNSSYPSETQARECENQKLPEMPPIGLIFGNTKGFYKDMTFCVAQTERVYGHYFSISLWACRDTNVGDSLGIDDICGDGSIM